MTEFTALFIAFAIVIPVTIFLIFIIGIWRIHKSIDAQTAVQIRQTEALEQIFFLMRNEAINNQATNNNGYNTGYNNVNFNNTNQGHGPQYS